MMKIHKAISTFEGVIKEYNQSYAGGLKKELDHYRQLSKMANKNAEEIAKELLTGSHQRYLNFAAAMSYRDEAIRRLSQAKLWDKNFSDFESLYDAVCDVIGGIPYIKDLVKYDVTKRLGVMFTPEITPKDYVYIQNGAKTGAEKLLGANFDDVNRVPISRLEPFFPNLSSVDIENILCIMKDYFSFESVCIQQDVKVILCDCDFDYDCLKDC